MFGRNFPSQRALTVRAAKLSATGIRFESTNDGREGANSVVGKANSFYHIALTKAHGNKNFVSARAQPSSLRFVARRRGGLTFCKEPCVRVRLPCVELVRGSTYLAASGNTRGTWSTCPATVRLNVQSAIGLCVRCRAKSPHVSSRLRVGRR